ncbi:MAG: hypothetical protein HC906_19920 [Bacteroidales bacterium]|nr:hypothetical protein [Bacteroidales bacterium]
MVKEGKEILSGPEVEAWAGAFENYSFEEIQPGKTKVSVETDTVLEYKEYFETTWPKALEKLKSMCEK